MFNQIRFRLAFSGVPQLFAMAAAMVISGSAYCASCSIKSLETNASETALACSQAIETLANDSERAKAYVIRARAKKRMGDYRGAPDDFDAALAITPQDPELLVWRGWSHYDMQEYQQALSLAGKAVSLDARNSRAYDLAASVMAIVGDNNNARKNYDLAVQSEPTNASWRFHRYQLFNKMGQAREALAEIDSILSLPATSIEAEKNQLYDGQFVTAKTLARLYRAVLLIQADRRTEAAQVYDQLVQDDPSALTFTTRAAFCQQFDLSSEADILSDLEKAIAYDPKFWGPYEIRAQLSFYAKQYESADSDFEKAIKLNPKRGLLRWWHFMTLRKLNRMDEAMADALSVIELDPYFLINSKIDTLTQHGYFQPPADDRKLKLALQDAVRACVLDESCW